jgi:hypothetical protein
MFSLVKLVIGEKSETLGDRMVNGAASMDSEYFFAH